MKTFFKNGLSVKMIQLHLFQLVFPPVTINIRLRQGNNTVFTTQ